MLLRKLPILSHFTYFAHKIANPKHICCIIAILHDFPTLVPWKFDPTFNILLNKFTHSRIFLIVAISYYKCTYQSVHNDKHERHVIIHTTALLNHENKYIIDLLRHASLSYWLLVST